MNAFDLFMNTGSLCSKSATLSKLHIDSKSAIDTIDVDDVLMSVCYAVVIRCLEAIKQNRLYRGEDLADMHTYTIFSDIKELIESRTEDYSIDVEILTNLAELRLSELTISHNPGYDKNLTSIAL